MQELDLFQHDQQGSDRVISKISDEKGWKQVRETLFANVGMNPVPVIHIIDANYEGAAEIITATSIRRPGIGPGIYTAYSALFIQVVATSPGAGDSFKKALLPTHLDEADQFEIREIQQPAAVMNE